MWDFVVEELKFSNSQSMHVNSHAVSNHLKMHLLQYLLQRPMRMYDHEGIQWFYEQLVRCVHGHKCRFHGELENSLSTFTLFISDGIWKE